MGRAWVLAAAALLAIGTRGALGEVNTAVVDVPAVSERYNKTIDLEAKFEEIRMGLNERRDALRDRLDRMQRSLQEELKPDTEEYEARQKELAMLQAELQWFVESEGKRIERRLAVSLKMIFTDIHAMVTEVAAERGIDVVLAADRLPDAEPGNPTQIRQQIVLQKVLYWSPRVDLTDQVIDRLNAKYGAEKTQAKQPYDGATSGPR